MSSRFHCYCCWEEWLFEHCDKRDYSCDYEDSAYYSDTYHTVDSEMVYILNISFQTKHINKSESETKREKNPFRFVGFKTFMWVEMVF